MLQLEIKTPALNDRSMNFFLTFAKVPKWRQWQGKFWLKNSNTKNIPAVDLCCVSPSLNLLKQGDSFWQISQNFPKMFFHHNKNKNTPVSQIFFWKCKDADFQSWRRKIACENYNKILYIFSWINSFSAFKIVSKILNNIYANSINHF